VISDTPVLGDDFILGNSKKTPRNLQEGPQLFNGCPYTGNIFTFKNQWYSAQDFLH
jgi:hypothetical protein